MEARGDPVDNGLGNRRYPRRRVSFDAVGGGAWQEWYWLKLAAIKLDRGPRNEEHDALVKSLFRLDMLHQRIGYMLHLLRGAARCSTLLVHIVEFLVQKQRRHACAQRSRSNRRIRE
jgi:hypothetical protein